MLAMMTMVVVPTSCGDDDDDDENGSKSSSNSLKGKVFVDEYEEDGYSWLSIYSFDDEIVTCYQEEVRNNEYGEDYSDKDTYRYEVLPNGLISFHNYFYKYKDGKLYFVYDDEENDEGTEDKTGRSAEQILKEWQEKHPKTEREQITEQGKPQLQVVEGGVYTAKNETSGLTFKFRVTETSGSYTSKDQVVKITIDGINGEFTLSDAGNSYLMLDGTKFITANTALAKENAKNIVMALACANSAADYTITSATINDTMNKLGATETLFATAR